MQTPALQSSERPTTRPNTTVVLVTLGFVAALYLTWTGAWVLLEFFQARGGWLATGAGQAVYWTSLKVVLWILPAFYVMRYAGVDLVAAFKGNGIRPILLWGVGAGLLIGAEVIVRKWLGQQPYVVAFSWPFVNAVIIAPIVEEIVFRGAVLFGLMKRYRFHMANVIASLLFVGAHLPGWHFSGVLIQNLTQPLGGALSIFVLGLIFGFVVRKSRSIAGGIVAHGINNFFSML